MMMTFAASGFPMLKFLAIFMLFSLGQTQSLDLSEYTCPTEQQKESFTFARWDKGGIVRFVPGVNKEQGDKEFNFYALTPCEKTQRFTIEVEEYDPDVIPESVSKVKAELDGKEEKEVYSCRGLIKTTLATKCIIEEKEAVKCKSKDDSDKFNASSSSNMRCSSKFSVSCTPEATQYRQGVFFFKSEIMTRVQFEGFPCPYEIKTFKGFQLLEKGGKGNSLDECVENVEREDCSDDDVETTPETDEPAPPPTEKSSFYCIFEDWKFIGLIASFCILLVVLIVMCIMLKRRRKREEQEELDKTLRERTSHWHLNAKPSPVKKPETRKKVPKKRVDKKEMDKEVEAVDQKDDEPDEESDGEEMNGGVEVPETVEKSTKFDVDVYSVEPPTIGGDTEDLDYNMLLKPAGFSAEPMELPSEYKSTINTDEDQASYFRTN